MSVFEIVCLALYIAGVVYTAVGTFVVLHTRRRYYGGRYYEYKWLYYIITVLYAIVWPIVLVYGMLRKTN